MHGIARASFYRYTGKKTKRESSLSPVQRVFECTYLLKAKINLAEEIKNMSEKKW